MDNEPKQSMTMTNLLLAGNLYTNHKIGKNLTSIGDNQRAIQSAVHGLGNDLKKGIANLSGQISKTNNLLEKGNKITAEGYEDVNGNKHYKMKLRTDDDLQTIFIHTETFMISKVSQKTKINGQEYLAETEFEDYISVEGIKEPRKTTQKYDGNVSHVVEYKKIEYDLPMSDTLFTRPIENK